MEAERCFVVIESKDAETGRWCECDYFTILKTPNEHPLGQIEPVMMERFDSRYTGYRTNKKHGTIDYYFENDLERLKCCIEKRCLDYWND